MDAMIEPGLELSIVINGVILYFSFIEYIDSSLLFVSNINLLLFYSQFSTLD